MGSKCSPCDRLQQHPANGIAKNSPACLALGAGRLEGGAKFHNGSEFLDFLKGRFNISHPEFIKM